VEMCNNNGACRKSDPGVMCPSFRATSDEQHLTRGRANTLRLALSGQLGAEALTSEAMRETMALCISCKGCKRECPTGVDMARMKIEFLRHYKTKHGLTLRDHLVAYLPRYAATASRFRGLLNLRNRLPLAAKLGEKLTGLSARRKLPQWHPSPYGAVATRPAGASERAVVLLVDTFNRWFEPENARAAERVLRRAGYAVIAAPAPDNGRPLCCGRTFLAAGLVEEARTEARRTIAALKPFVESGIPIVGLEPSCLLTLRDEFTVLLPGADSAALAKGALLFEEFISAEHKAGRLKLDCHALPEQNALLHGHCHQKAFNTVGAVEAALRLVPGLAVKAFDSTCCGMAGAFGYEAEHYDMSMMIGELAVLPTIRAASAETLIVAGGTSCRHQIADGAQRRAEHVARILDRASAPTPP
ncbi:MAG TPA: 4Fe-4S dicluster domain-containing protein, partial [Stellaceae bacterium]|nr:4Fe-4S dicluster domain-containing protein [Stellaceae bacterium]